MLRAGQITLRSQLPELVRQEFRGLLLAHHMVRRMMAQASLDRGLDPDTLSFTTVWKSSINVWQEPAVP